MYKVLWFDDEHETLELIKEEAFLKDIKLIGYTNASSGLKELKDNFSNYDAVLLDGLFFKTEEESGNPDSSKAFGEVAKTLGNLKEKGTILPWFTYSGQKKFVKDTNELWDVLKDVDFAKGKVFDKNKDEDLEELCNEIKKEADQQPLTQVKHNNPKIFKIFDSGNLSESTESQVKELLISSLPSNPSEMKSFLVNIRSIQESCFIKLGGINVIPNPRDSFNNINKHLSGNKNFNSNYRATTIEYQSREIENLQSWIYITCGTYIHNLDRQHYDGYMISNYAIESLRNGILEILLWYNKTYLEYR